MFCFKKNKMFFGIINEVLQISDDGFYESYNNNFEEILKYKIILNILNITRSIENI